jgi:hypothetical protein
MRTPVLALTSDGQPYQWLTWDTAITMKYKGLVTYEMGDESQFFGGTSRLTGEVSHIEVGSIISVRGNFKRSSRTPPLTNMNLFRRDICTCSYCGKHFSESNLTRDHIVPVSKGGQDVWGNVVAACKKCNGKKGNQMLEDTDFELLWVPYTPNRCEALVLQNRRILADQAQYIANFIPKHSRVPQYLAEQCGIVLQ